MSEDLENGQPMSQLEEQIGDVPDQEVVFVRERPYVFQMILAADQKRLENKCRHPRSRQLDPARLLRELYNAVVLGQADAQGHLIPGSKKPYQELTAREGNAFDTAITSFLGYGDE